MSIDPSLDFGFWIADFRLTATPSSLATRHPPLFSRHSSPATGHSPRGNWLCFSGSLTPWAGLSQNAPTFNTINTASKLALFWRFSFTAISPLCIHWPLFFRSTPARPDQRVQAGHRPSPAGYCHPPTTELAKTERSPISTSGPSIFSMSPKFSMLPNQAIPSDKSIRSSPARRRPTVDHSHAAGAAQRQGLQARLPNGYQPQCQFSACSP